MIVFNSTIRTAISVDKTTIMPLAYAQVPEALTADPSILRHIKMGNLKLMANADVLTPERIMAKAYEEGNVVIRRNVAFGDVLLCSAIAANIKEYGKVNIFFITDSNAYELVRYDPNIKYVRWAGEATEAISLYRNYINLNNVPESYEETNRGHLELNRIEIMCWHLGIPVTTQCPEYFIREGEIAAGRQLLSKYKPPFLGLCPKATRIERMWPIENYPAIAKEWKSQTGGTAFYFSNSRIAALEKDCVPIVYDIRFAAAVAYSMGKMLTVDSLWCHLAAALNVPQVIMASATDGYLLSKGYDNCIVLQGHKPCSPCWYMFSKGGCSRDNYSKCLLELEQERVINALWQL